MPKIKDIKLNVTVSNIDELKNLINQLDETVNQINEWKPKISIDLPSNLR
ncbi:MAG: hypothetical protein ABF415_06745 [Leuconostoc pseudomesenteroides]